MTHAALRPMSGLGAVLIMAVMLVLMAAFPAHADARTRYVGKARLGGGSCTSPNHRTIQKALKAARPGDTIKVCPGTYRERLKIAKSGITIKATRPKKAVLAAPPARVGVRRKFRDLVTIAGADRVRIQGMKVIGFPTKCSIRIRAAIRITNGAKKAVIRQNEFRNTGKKTWSGKCVIGDAVGVSGGSTALIEGNLIHDFAYTGIRAEGPGTVATVNGNTLRFFHRKETRGQGFRGIFGWKRARLSAAGNTIVGLPSGISGSTPVLDAGIGTQGHDEPGSIFSDNLIRYVAFGLTPDGDGGEVRDNRVKDTKYNGIASRTLTNTLLVDNTITRAGRHGIDLSGETSGNTLRRNDARGAAESDCRDTSTGGGTLGTANTWESSNLGDPDDSYPKGLCELPAP